MKNHFMDQKVLNNLEMPLKKLMELNVKTIQSLSYIKPNDLLTIKKPEDIVERHMSMMIHNQQLALNYMKEAFHILESHWLNVSHTTEGIATAHKVSSSVKKSVKKAVSSTKSAVKKSASSVKTAAKKVSVSKPKVAVSKPKAAASKTKVAASKPKTSAVTHPVKHEVRSFHDKAKHNVHAKDVGQNMPKVSGVAEKSGIKDLGLLNKGNFPN